VILENYLNIFMSMVAIPFAVDLDKVKNTFGSNNKELLQNVKSTKMYSTYADQMEFYSYDKALEDIIMRPGELTQNAGHVYGYALMAICDYLGTQLLPNCDGIYSGDEWEDAKIIMKDGGLIIDLERMFEPANVFPIPPIDDFPVINYFTREEVSLLAGQMENLEIDETKADFENDDFDETQACLFNLKQCFKIASGKRLEIVTFAH
jgi:hypothetical protein